MTTTIQISDEVKAKLEKMKLFMRETYNDTIERMIEDEMEINAQTKKELAERGKEKGISHEKVKKMFGL